MSDHIVPDQVWEHRMTGRRVVVTRIKPTVRDVDVKNADGRPLTLSMVTLRGNYRLVEEAPE